MVKSTFEDLRQDILIPQVLSWASVSVHNGIKNEFWRIQVPAPLPASPNHATSTGLECVHLIPG